MKKKILLTVAVLFSAALFQATPLFAAGPPTVDLGTAENFAILSKAGITDVPTSIITGDVGSSPISGSSIGIPCGEVTGTIYSTDAAGPLPCRIIGPSLLTTAVSDMEAAYTDAATRTPAVGPRLDIGAGTVTPQTLAPDIYTWTTPVDITGDLTLSGGATDIWIFQVNGTLTLDAGMSILLTGGAVPENVFWQTTQTVNLMAGSQFEGNILSQTDIAMRSGAVLNGRALAQTEVTLIGNTISIPSGFTPISIPGTLHVIKIVINDNGRTKTADDFTMQVTGTAVSDTSFAGENSPGTTVTLDAGAYTVDENNDSGYTQSFSSDCSGTILAGEDRTCTITNDDTVISSLSSTSGGLVYGCKDPIATNYNFFSRSDSSLCEYGTSASRIAIGSFTTDSTTGAVITPFVTHTGGGTLMVTPKLPKTGFQDKGNNSWYTLLFNQILHIIR